MAHLVKLAQKCQRCTKTATCQVFNAHNASLGIFCTPHGTQRLAEIQRSERAIDAGRTS